MKNLVNWKVLLVTVLFILLSVWLAFTISKDSSKENVDNINKIIHNDEGELKENEDDSFKINDINSDRIQEIVDQKVEIKLEELDKQNEIQPKQQENTYDTNWKTFEATYYTAFCNTGCIGITASGYSVKDTIYYNGKRIIAVDPRVIPLYSVVEVKTPYEIFEAVALDTGGSIKNQRVDILVSTKKEAFALGRHDVQIRVIEFGQG